MRSPAFAEIPSYVSSWAWRDGRRREAVLRPGDGQSARGSTLRGSRPRMIIRARQRLC